MEQPKELTICHLEVLLMPNGEVVFLGNHVGWFKEIQQYLTPEKETHGN